MELQCGECAKFFTFAKLKEHKREVHSKENCEICNDEITAGNFNNFILILDKCRYHYPDPIYDIRKFCCIIVSPPSNSTCPF